MNQACRVNSNLRVDELNLNTGAHSIIILVSSVEEGRHIIGLNRANVEVLAQVNVNTAT